MFAGTVAACAALLGVLLLGRQLPGWAAAVPAAAAVIALAWRIQAARRPERGPWALLTAGLLCAVVADLVGAHSGIAAPPAALAALSTLGHVLGLAGMVFVARSRGPERDPVGALDGVTVALAVATPLIAHWQGPPISAATLADPRLLAAVVGPALDILVLAVVVRLLLGKGEWTVSAGSLILAAMLTVSADLADRQGAEDAVVAALVASAAGTWLLVALHRSAELLLRPTSSVSRFRPRLRLWLLGVIVFVPLSVVCMGYVDAKPIDTTAVLAPLAGMAVLIVGRTVLVARRAHAAWQGAAILSAAALLIVLAGFTMIRSTAGGQRQAAAAEQLDALAVDLQSADGVLARGLSGPDAAIKLVPLLISQTLRSSAEINKLDIPERAEIGRLQQAYLGTATSLLRGLGSGATSTDFQGSLAVILPPRAALLSRVAAVADQYHRAAVTSARHGREVTVAVLFAALITLWALLMRFAAVGRRAEAAEGRARAVRESEARVRALLGASGDAILVVNPSLEVLAHGYQLARLLGRPDDLAPISLTEVLSEQEAEHARTVLASITGHGESTDRLQWSLSCVDGSVMQVEAFAVDHTGDPLIGGVVVSVRDITERIALEAALEHQSFHDRLTGLPNRAVVTERLAALFTHEVADAASRRVHALVMLDLDDFRSVNDSFGHRLGDQILLEVTARLKANTATGDLLARVGGDGFAYLVEDIAGEEEARERAAAMTAAMLEPIVLADGAEHQVRGSVGIAMSDGSGADTPQEQASLMFRDAELAMYEAKRHDGNSVELYAPHMHDAVTQRLQLRSEMILALERNEFLLHYQPIIGLRAGDIVGYEALVRWQHPERGVVSPADFIPVAEQSGLIVELGDWVLREACRQLVEWQPNWPQTRYVAVNVAGQQLERLDHVDRVRAALEESGLPPAQLVLEVTESSLIHDTEASSARLQALRDLGVRLAIDDFGTGYSSLSYLHRFAMDILKIDKSFIDHVAEEGPSLALVDAITTMADRLGLSVVAEGIEELDQVTVLRRMPCAGAQGFHFSRPLPADRVLEYLAPDMIRRAA